MTTILEEIKCGLQVTKATLKIIAVSTGESELTYDMREQEKLRGEKRCVSKFGRSENI